MSTRRLMMITSAVLAVTTVSGTMAATPREPEIVLACKFVEGSKFGTFASSVNQVLIDSHEGTLEFRAAETMGTTNPINYTFQSNESDRVSLSKSPLGYIAGGVRYGSPFAISVDLKSGTIVWTFIDGTVLEYSRYQCAS